MGECQRIFTRPYKVCRILWVSAQERRRRGVSTAPAFPVQDSNPSSKQLPPSPSTTRGFKTQRPAAPALLLSLVEAACTCVQSGGCSRNPNFGLAPVLCHSGLPGKSAALGTPSESGLALKQPRGRRCACCFSGTFK